MSGNGQEPATVEHGRFRLFEAPDGLVLARAVNTCDRCQNCGCGEQQEPVPLPDPRRGRMHLMGWLAANMGAGPLGALGRVMSHD